MMKSVFLSLLFFFAIQLAVAQKKELILKKSEKALYLDHSVAAKESFYSIGRLYNVHPKHLASFNKLDVAKGISIDQVVRIPLTDSNFTQKGNTGTPVYYIVSGSEELNKISSSYNNVALASLRNWNNLANDNLSAGAKLIVGFLKTKGMPSVTITTEVKQGDPVVKNEQKPVPVKDKVKAEEKPPVADPPVVQEKPVVKKEEPVKTVSNKVIPNSTITEVSPALTTVDQGYFKRTFEQQVKVSPISKSETVTGGIFKTTSGWEDAKYYLLIDKVSPGTIVKVINPANNKAVFAKVLGEMSGIRQNEGMDIRISNAAAAALGITEQDKYIVRINY